MPYGNNGIHKDEAVWLAPYFMKKHAPDALMPYYSLQ